MNSYNDFVKLIYFRAGVVEKFGKCVIGQKRSEFGWGVPTFVDHNEVLKSVRLVCAVVKTCITVTISNTQCTCTHVTCT